MKPRRLIVLGCLLAAFAWPVAAQDYHAEWSGAPGGPGGGGSDERLNATGKAEVEMSPDRAVLGVAVTGTGEDPQDAMVKFRDNRRRAIEALEAVPLEGLTVEPMGVSLSYMYDQQELNQMRNGMPNAVAPTPKIVVTERLRVVIPGLKAFEDEDALVGAMQQVITTVRDQGLGLGQDPTAEMAGYSYGYNAQPQTLFSYESTGAEAKLATARAEAVEDAKANAIKIAALIGATLGPIVSFSENVSLPYEQTVDMYGNRRGYTPNQQRGVVDDDAVSSSLLGPATVRLTVSLRFAITPGSAAASAEASE